MHSHSSCDSGDKHLWIGLISLVIGSLFLLERFGYVSPEAWGYIWPLILIIVGLKILILGGKRSCCSKVCETPAPTAKKTTAKKAKKRASKKK